MQTNTWIHMMLNALLLTDGYKTGHHRMYPKNTTLVYSNFTGRSNRYAPPQCQDGVVVFGTQLMIRQLHELFELNFFSRPKDEVISEIKRELSLYLNQEYDVSHFEALHDLGYLPIRIKSLDEGTICPIKIPMMTIHNTKKEFFWVTNYLETLISNLLWKPMVSASIAKAYREVLSHWQKKTDKNNSWIVDFQGHDFSMRGMDSIEATISSGMGHLTSFLGTDSLPTLWAARKYYNEENFVGGSVNATEHSVMCAGGAEDEVETFRRLLETFPEGILSVVSDTWDLWEVCTNHVKVLKDEIMARNGKLVIRPDSGNPVDILCGLPIREFTEERDAERHFNFNLQPGDNLFKLGGQYYKVVPHDGNDFRYERVEFKPEFFGVIELLWDAFGGTVNEQGYKVLDSHIGAIYGDSITLDRAEEICRRLEAKGFASTNVVLGIGSFTYQFNTRDTFGFAMKATYCEFEEFVGQTDHQLNDSGVRVVGREIFKNPVTDDGTKKSATGLLSVYEEDGVLRLKERCTWEQEAESLLKLRYHDGEFHNETTLTEIRGKLSAQSYSKAFRAGQ